MFMIVLIKLLPSALLEAIVIQDHIWDLLQKKSPPKSCRLELVVDQSALTKSVRGQKVSLWAFRG